MKKYYVITQVLGEYDMGEVRTLFVTEHEYMAKWYCSKANTIFERYREFYKEWKKRLLMDSEKLNIYCHLSERLNLIYGHIGYSKIEFRNIKTKP